MTLVEEFAARKIPPSTGLSVAGRKEVKRNLEWASCLLVACLGLSVHEGIMHIAGVTRGG